MATTEELLRTMATLLEQQQTTMATEREEAKKREENMQKMLEKALGAPNPKDKSNGETNKKIPVNATPAPMLSHSASLREFSVWRQKLADYMLLTGINKTSNDRQKAVIRSLLDDEWVRITKFALDIDMDEDNVDVENILNGMQNHLRSQRNIVLDRKEFYMRNQQTDEKFDDYFITLQEIAGFCDFCENCLDEQYRDRIVTGVHDEETLKNLLSTKDLTLGKAVEICRANENAANNTENLQSTSESINRIAKYKKTPVQRNSKYAATKQPQSNKCKFCGGDWHQSLRQCPVYKFNDSQSQQQYRRTEDQKFGRTWEKNMQARKCKKCGNNWHEKLEYCPAIDKNCAKCGEVGHFARYCIKKVQYEDEESDSENLWRVVINKVDNRKKTPKIDIDVTYENKSIKVETTPDSGAEESVMSIKKAKQLGINVDNLKPCKNTLYGVNGTKLTTIGTAPVKLRLGETTVPVEVIIVLEVNGFLLSWYHAIDLGILPKCFPNQIKQVHQEPVEKIHKREDPPICKDKHPSRKVREEHAKLLKSTFSSVFDTSKQLKPMKGEPMRIELREDAIPYAVTAARSIPFAWKEQVKNKIKDMVDKNIITEVTKPTEWCHPLVLQPKKDSSEVRLCVDLTKLNTYVKRGAHPVLTPHEAVASIDEGSEYFTHADAKTGYWQTEIHEDDQELTTFITPWGRYKFLRAPMGLTTSGDEYNRRGDEALQGIPETVKIVDDVLSYESDYQKHLNNVWEILNRCKEYSITLNPDKFEFAQEEVEYCGYHISKEGFTPEKSKVTAITEFKVPENITELKSFMGLVNHLGEFSSEISKLAQPLRDLLKKKNEWCWTEVHNKAFEEVRNALSNPPIMAYFDPELPVELETDAARLKGLGYALKQKHGNTWKLVDCNSRFLTETESRYSTIELELLAIAWAVKKCRMYLAGRNHFKIITDHKPLLPIINTKSLADIENPRLQRLREKLISYNFTLCWKKGAEHAVPDALSRAPADNPTKEDEIVEQELEDHIHAVTMLNINSIKTDDEESHDLLLEEIHMNSTEDPEYNLLKKTILDGFPSNHNEMEASMQPYAKMKDRLCIDGKLILCGHRLVIPRKMRKDVLKRLHSSHQGIVKTRQRARQTVYWPGIDNDVTNTVNACKDCQELLPSLQKEPMMSETEPSRPFQSVSTDYFDHAGKPYLIYTDRLSGWPMVKTFNNGATATKLISALRKIFAATGVPERLRADNGPQYISKELRNFLEQWSVTISPSSPHYHQSNGHAESSVKAVKHLIIKTTTNGNLDTDEFALGLLEIRNSPRSDGRSPAQVLFGHPIRSNVPAHKRAYEKEWQKDEDLCDEKKREIKEKVEMKYNTTAKSLPEFQIGSHVNIQDHRTGRWSHPGVVVKVGMNRQYLVKKKNGRLVWRNRRHLRQQYPIIPNPIQQSPPTQPYYNSPPKYNTPQRVSLSNEPEELTLLNPEKHHIPSPRRTQTETVQRETPNEEALIHIPSPKTTNPGIAKANKVPLSKIKNFLKSPLRPNSSEPQLVEGRRRQAPKRLQIDPKRKNYQ